MKKILLIAVLLGAMLSGTVYFVCIAAPSVFFGKGLKGSGNIVTRTIEAPAFDRIDAARAVKVVITDKTSGKITIAADDNVMDYVVVEANGGRLTATIDKSINNLSNADVTVTVPANGSIRALDASSAAKISGDVVLNAERTGYVIALPIPGIVTQVQTNMGATINIDWILQVAADLMSTPDKPVSLSDLIPRLDDWFNASRPGAILYHPYISEAGERGPFVNAYARAGFVGLSSRDRFPEMVRSVVEGLGMATRDCYTAMGEMPAELRITGGAARSKALRSTLAAAVNAPVRVSSREEAGAAGAAMMAAVAIGAYPSMDACIAEWVEPLLGPCEAPDGPRAKHYEELFVAYQEARLALTPVWDKLASDRAFPAKA